jgi:hypothetical protein
MKIVELRVQLAIILRDSENLREGLAKTHQNLKWLSQIEEHISNLKTRSGSFFRSR